MSSPEETSGKEILKSISKTSPKSSRRSSDTSSVTSLSHISHSPGPSNSPTNPSNTRSAQVLPSQTQSSLSAVLCRSKIHIIQKQILALEKCAATMRLATDTLSNGEINRKEENELVHELVVASDRVVFHGLRMVREVHAKTGMEEEDEKYLDAFVNEASVEWASKGVVRHHAGFVQRALGRELWEVEIRNPGALKSGVGLSGDE